MILCIKTFDYVKKKNLNKLRLHWYCIHVSLERTRVVADSTPALTAAKCAAIASLRFVCDDHSAISFARRTGWCVCVCVCVRACVRVCVRYANILWEQT